jgi:chromosome segregation ATPase
MNLKNCHCIKSFGSSYKLFGNKSKDKTMQPQIQAIKQLLDTNNAIASQIDKTIVDWLGDSASWENASTYQSIAAFDSGHGSLPDDLYGSSPKSLELLEILWRSRIDLNDVKINAEEVDLDGFLSEALFKDATEDLINEKAHNENLIKELQLAVSDDNKSQTIQSLQTQVKGYQALCEGYLETQQERDRTISHMDTEIDSLRMDVKERDQRVSSLKTQIKGFEAALELANSKAIAPNLDAFKSAVDEAVNPTLFEKIAERDRQIGELQAEINRLKSWLKKREDHQALWANDAKDPDIEILEGDVKDLCDRLRASANQISDRNTQIQELQVTVNRHREQFDSLKSHFEVALKAIAMNLNALKGARKPDETKEVNGVMTTFRNYDDNLTHHHKTVIIENVQRAIAEEAKKLKGIDLKDFSFDEIPF